MQEMQKPNDLLLIFQGGESDEVAMKENTSILSQMSKVRKKPTNESKSQVI